MARLYLWSHHAANSFYSVDKSVGRGGVNARDDILLVQFFLRVAMEPYKAWPTGSITGEKTGFVPPGNTKPISIDGIFGRETLRYIKHYQEDGERRYTSNIVPTDDKIDPVKVGGSGMLDAMNRLNWDYVDRRGAMIDDIRKDPLFPFGLYASLSIS